MIVDFHTHTFPDKIAVCAVDKLKKACRCRAFSDGTGSALLASMRRAGIGRSVVLPVVTNPAKTVSVNDFSLAMAQMNARIFFGGIHPDTPDAPGELERIAQAGLKGIKIHPVYQDTCIDDSRFVRILKKANELNLIVVMHAGDDIGFPGRVRCSPPMIRRALDQTGEMKLICAHIGGWRNWDQAEKYLCDTPVMLDTALSHGDLVPLEEGSLTQEELRLLDEEAFCHLVRCFGSRRILFGSDSPWSDQAISKDWILQTKLTEEEKENILGRNAAAMLGLEI